ncbi:LCP family protein [Nocardioides caeni]|uniref:LytR family transcriptional regulator n=1 Tax=Nocardioides caeni TaxID=574700 RepID=A0A4S8NE39_9ACTN|nr:LCP family protein [Nocardioides caeni]THV14807.1 LytR family transcriptional regulator [Nocardioides caeni]
MTQESPTQPGGRARRVATSRADRRRARAARSHRGGRRKAAQPRKTVLRVILASLMSLGLLTGVGVVLVYNNWNGNLEHESVSDQLRNRPEKVEVAGPQEPMNILVMGSDTRSGEGNGIDGEAGGGLSDTTILFHLSADRKFAYGISVPRDTAVIRPSCYEKDGSEIPGSGGYVKWNEAYATGGPACTIQQFEQTYRIRIDNYVVIDFNQFKDMVNALDGVEVCVPFDIDDDNHNIHLDAGTREIQGNEALAYVRVRYGIGQGIDPNRTRRQQAFIGSMINKALTLGMVARPDRLIRFMNAATSSLHTDFENIAEMADLARTAQGIGADNIKFVTPPWIYSDKVSSGIELTSEADRLWRLVRQDRPLTQEFLKDAISADDKPDGSGSTTDPSQGSSDSPSGSPSDDATDPTDPSDTATDPGSSGGLSSAGREAAGLCS